MVLPGRLISDSILVQRGMSNVVICSYELIVTTLLVWTVQQCAAVIETESSCYFSLGSIFKASVERFYQRLFQDTRQSQRKLSQGHLPTDLGGHCCILTFCVLRVVFWKAHAGMQSLIKLKFVLLGYWLTRQLICYHFIVKKCYRRKSSQCKSMS